MDIDKNAKIIWNYMQMHMELTSADAIFVLCSMDTRVAERVVELYKLGYAEHVIISGGMGRLTNDRFTKPEAQVFADILIQAGVPKESLVLEEKSTNTGENIRFTYELLQGRGLQFDSFILVQKPYMERRTYATFKKQWPDFDAEIMVTSPRIKFGEYFTKDMPKDLVINIMVGDLQRIHEYPKLGFQIEQSIPDDVWRAYDNLVQAGFVQHLVPTL